MDLIMSRSHEANVEDEMSLAHHLHYILKSFESTSAISFSTIPQTKSLNSLLKHPLTAIQIPNKMRYLSVNKTTREKSRLDADIPTHQSYFAQALLWQFLRHHI